MSKTCGNCKYFVESQFECHRLPPYHSTLTCNKYPQVCDSSIACGEYACDTHSKQVIYLLHEEYEYQESYIFAFYNKEDAVTTMWKDLEEDIFNDLTDEEKVEFVLDKSSDATCYIPTRHNVSAWVEEVVIDERKDG